MWVATKSKQVDQISRSYLKSRQRAVIENNLTIQGAVEHFETRNVHGCAAASASAASTEQFLLDKFPITGHTSNIGDKIVIMGKLLGLSDYP